MGTPPFERRLWTFGALAAGFIGTLCVLLSQAWFTERTPEARGVPPSQILQTHLNAIASSLFVYEETHNWQALDNVRQEGEKVADALRRTRESASNPAQAVQLQHLADDLRNATVGVLTADSAQADQLNAFMSHLDDMRMLADSRQGSERESGALEAVATNMMIYLRTGTPEALGAYRRSQDTVTALLETYPNSEKIRGALAKAVDAGRQLIDQQQNKTALVADYDRQQRELTQLLMEMSASSPKTESPAPHAFVGAGMLCAACLCAVLLWMGYSIQKRLFTPLATLTAGAEAAAAGDLSRIARIDSSKEISRLSLAMQRMTDVLSRSENLIYHLATLVEASGDAIISFSIDGVILTWNNGAQRIYGYTADEMKGQAITRLAPFGKTNSFTPLIEAVNRGEKMKPFEMVQSGKHGRRVRVLVRATCIYDSTRQIIGASLCLQDLSNERPSKLNPQDSKTRAA